MTLKTSDMAICAEVSQFTVRDYGEQGLLGPIFRARSSSYRSFDPRLVPQLYLVKTLRELGCTPQQIREYGQNRTPEKALEVFRDYSARLSGEIAAMQKKMDMLQSRVALIEWGVSANPDKIALCTMPEQACRYSALEYGNENAKNLEHLRRAIGQIRQDGNPGCPLGYVYRDFSALLANPNRPAQVVSYDPQGPNVRPADEYLVGTVTCYYGQTNFLPRRMHAQAQRDHLEFYGPAYAVYLFDAASVTEPEEYLLQIAVAVRRGAATEEGKAA